MKDDYLNNDEYFNFEKLRLNESKFRIATKCEETVIELGLQAANEKITIGLTARAGYGCYTALNKLIKQFNGIHYFLEPTGRDSLADWLIKILYLEIPPEVVRLSSSKPLNLIDSIVYLFKHIKSKRNRLIIIYNFHHFKESQYPQFIKFCNELKGHVGIVFTIDEMFYEKLIFRSENNRPVKDFLNVIRAFKLPSPQKTELAELLLQRGILARKIIDKILFEVEDFHSCNKSIDHIKEVLKRRGRL